MHYLKKIFVSLILCTITTYVSACPTCIGKVTKKTPSFFEDACYQQKDTKTPEANNTQKTPSLEKQKIVHTKGEAHEAT